MEQCNKDQRHRLMRIKKAIRDGGFTVSELSEQTGHSHARIKDALAGWYIPEVFRALDRVLFSPDNEEYTDGHAPEAPAADAPDMAAGHLSSPSPQMGDGSSVSSDASDADVSASTGVLYDDGLLDGRVLSALRKSRGITQRALAQAIGLKASSSTMISEMEREVYPYPDLRRRVQDYLASLIPDVGDANAGQTGETANPEVVEHRTAQTDEAVLPSRDDSHRPSSPDLDSELIKVVRLTLNIEMPVNDYHNLTHNLLAAHIASMCQQKGE